jgi:hypothetical protein
MHPPATDELFVPAFTEREKVEAWRLHVLIETGYPTVFAERLAAAVDVDLHQAVALLAAGCTPQLAAAILL